MKKSKITIIIVLILGVVVFGVNFINNQKEKLPDIDYLKHFYIAEDAQGEKIYLLGTMHLTNNPVTNIPKEILDAFNEADKVYIEAKIDLEEAQKYQNQLYENSITEMGNKNINIYWEKIKLNYDSIKSNYNNFNAMTIQSLATQEIIEELGLSAENTMDSFIYNKSVNENKQIVEFDGIEEQYRLIADLSKQSPTIILKQIANKDDYLEETKKSYLDFCEGKEINDLIDKFVTNENSKELLVEKENYMNLLINNRNQNMLNKLLDGSKNVKFVSIGAGHIYGEKGLIKTLQSNGFTVQKVAK